MNNEYIINKIEEHEKEIKKCKELFDLTMIHFVSKGQNELSCELSKVFAAAELFHEKIIGEYKTLLEEKNK